MSGGLMNKSIAERREAAKAQEVPQRIFVAGLNPIKGNCLLILCVTTYNNYVITLHTLHTLQPRGSLMARQGISKKQVFEAASALQDEGIAPTVKAVRQRIGSGSFSTISSHLDDWKSEHVGQNPANIPEMPEKVMLAFQQVWATAAKAAHENVDTQRQSLEAMRREMDQDKADMSAEIEQLEKALEETAAKVGELEKELEAQRRDKVQAEGLCPTCSDFQSSR